jgi:hypothetical protein
MYWLYLSDGKTNEIRSLSYTIVATTIPQESTDVLFAILNEKLKKYFTNKYCA